MKELCETPAGCPLSSMQPPLSALLLHPRSRWNNIYSIISHAFLCNLLSCGTWSKAILQKRWGLALVLQLLTCCLGKVCLAYTCVSLSRCAAPMTSKELRRGSRHSTDTAVIVDFDAIAQEVTRDGVPARLLLQTWGYKRVYSLASRNVCTLCRHRNTMTAGKWNAHCRHAFWQ